MNTQFPSEWKFALPVTVLKADVLTEIADNRFPHASNMVAMTENTRASTASENKIDPICHGSAAFLLSEKITFPLTHQIFSDTDDLLNNKA